MLATWKFSPISFVRMFELYSILCSCLIKTKTDKYIGYDVVSVMKS